MNPGFRLRARCRAAVRRASRDDISPVNKVSCGVARFLQAVQGGGMSRGVCARLKLFRAALGRVVCGIFFRMEHLVITGRPYK